MHKCERAKNGEWVKTFGAAVTHRFDYWLKHNKYYHQNVNIATLLFFHFDCIFSIIIVNHECNMPAMTAGDNAKQKIKMRFCLI